MREIILDYVNKMAFIREEQRDSSRARAHTHTRWRPEVEVMEPPEARRGQDQILPGASEESSALSAP